jgi:hypothetical protein
LDTSLVVLSTPEIVVQERFGGLDIPGDIRCLQALMEHILDAAIPYGAQLERSGTGKFQAISAKYSAQP